MIQRTHPAMKLMDAIESLFASGADESTGEDELLALLDGLRWRLMVHAILLKSFMNTPWRVLCAIAALNFSPNLRALSGSTSRHSLLRAPMASAISDLWSFGSLRKWICL